MTQPDSTSDTITVPRELYDWLVEYAILLHGTWSWKHSAKTEDRNDEEYSNLSVILKQAVALRDS